MEWFQRKEIPTSEPHTGVALPLHCALMRDLGVALTEITWPDELTGAFAAGLLAGGFTADERVATYPRNVPQLVLGLVGTWKAGGHDRRGRLHGVAARGGRRPP
ncbi:hypothetical protein WHI96_15610 [Pseudonocardia tropica]|uniref:Uncharacterized protein n=1 Tax=Pseudonocardia tropica TaxID=681289 RepID=A0ABV1JXF7_9PSEU